eukprot:5691712-Pleurochrysis_carterae.AAC.1
MLSSTFKVSVWTAAQRPYAIQIMNNIWPSWRQDLLFLRSYSHCSVLPSGEVVKDLTDLPLGYDIMLVDDNPVNYSMNTKKSFSVWKIRPFVCGMRDNELTTVMDYVEHSVINDYPFST